MSSDDQHFLDALTTLPSDLCDGIEKTVDKAAGAVRYIIHATGDSLSHVVSVPERFRSPPPPPPPPRFGTPFAAAGVLGTCRQWVSDHPRLVAALAGFFGTGAIVLYSQRKAYARKRRARRAHNGARKEVVVVAASTTTPIARSVILDLERRGFIVYVLCNTQSDEDAVKSERKTDIIPMYLNITDQKMLDVQNTMEHFSRLLSTPQFAGGSTTAHSLAFTGLVMIPDTTYPMGPVETLSPELWSDAFNAKVLGTVATAQAFIRTVADHQARMLILTPAIIPALRPAFHGVESTVVRALDSFVECLRSEMQTLGVKVCQIRMGNFDVSAVGSERALQRNWRADILSWAASAREAYAENYLSSKEDDRGRGILTRQQRGSPLRELNNAVFDALTVHRPWQTVRCGRGARIYGLVGTVAPPGLVSWMIGLRRRRERDHSSSSVSSSAHWESVEAARADWQHATHES